MKTTLVFVHSLSVSPQSVQTVSIFQHTFVLFFFKLPEVCVNTFALPNTAHYPRGTAN